MRSHLPATTDALRLRDRPRDGHEQREGVFGGGNRVAVGRVHHDDAARRGGFHVHVVHADARAADDLERLGGFEHALVDLGFRAHDERGAIGDDLQELVFLEAGLEDHVERAVALEVFHAPGRDGVGNQHFGFVHENERVGSLVKWVRGTVSKEKETLDERSRQQ